MEWHAWLTDPFGLMQQWLFETVVQPVMFAAGMGNLLEDGFDATGWLLVGLLEIAVMLAIFAPLQRWRPVEPLRDRRAVRVDVIYTLIHRLGLFRVGIFFVLQPLFDMALGHVRAAGWGTMQLDALWPGVTDRPWVTFLLYLVVLDFVEYLIHRGQHTIDWWWRLHALHHSQRQMTMWSDARNHLLDDIIHSTIVVVVAQLIGVPPGQFVVLVALTQLSQSLQHANLRLHFGRVGERLWVSPRFHRLHHAIGVGHEEVGRPGVLGGCNFGVLLPWWDMLLRTANFDLRYLPTGVRDQVEPDAQGRLRDYGRGFWSQQWLGLRRLVGRA
ncbi:sterol desaturase/sphingolipid hydroxylase (fatty acid hydroxylase superfamily) [Pseudacidovorax sp. 1753]|uniref:sterol desaturase family protein n=1 Tax=Pseudacidovorax sp. 1753 TaxID=3156419 RepID=UPI003398BC71